MMFGHPMPNSLINLNVDERLNFHIQIPLDEFANAYAKPISETSLVSSLSPYIRKHISFKDITGRKMFFVIDDIWIEADSNVFNGQYKELNIKIGVPPNPEYTNRTFVMEYDLVIHQIVTHQALVSIQSDYDGGKINGDFPLGIISYDYNTKLTKPLQVNLGSSQPFKKGFLTMMYQGGLHIAEGLDHILFLLFLLISSIMIVDGNKWKVSTEIKQITINAVKIISAFTVGHSLTLALGTFGYNTLPTQWIEIGIAVSVLITVIHSIKPLFYCKEMFVSLIFGFIHGFAFSNILVDLGLSKSRIIQSLFAFNIGIEIFQIIIALIIIPLLILLSKTDLFNYFRGAIAFFGLVVSVSWLIDRIFVQENIVTKWLNTQPTLILYIVIYLFILTIIGWIWHVRKSKLSLMAITNNY
jgi:hypothetical protein